MHRKTTAVLLFGIGLLAQAAAAQNRDSLPELQRREVRSLLDARNYPMLERRYSDLQRRYEAGEIDDWTLLVHYQPFYDTQASTERLTTEWIAQYPKSYYARLARGIHLRKLGEERRGGGWISETSPEKLQALWAHLDAARSDLEASLSLTARPIVTLVHLLNITKHREGGHANRLWLDAAIRVDPKTYGARRRFMYTLTPRWGGSYEEMWAFLTECRAARLPEDHLRIYEAIIWEDLADTLWRQKRNGEAVPIYRRAAELLKGIDNSERRSALYGVIAAAHQDGKLETAASEVEEYLQLSADNPRVLAYRAWLKEKRQKLDEAWRDYLRAAELGDAWAQLKVGSNLYYGSPPHVAADPARGIAWLERSAAQGNADAKKLLDSLSRK